jgi:hypothetical protein
MNTQFQRLQRPGGRWVQPGTPVPPGNRPAHGTPGKAVRKAGRKPKGAR